MHVLRDAGRRVHGDRRPDRIDVILADGVAEEEVAGGIRAIDPKRSCALLCAGVRSMS
jgi:hypothetical protein